MVITKTPFRMSFFGGGTDYKEFYEKYGGSVLSTSIDKYCYVTVTHLPRFFDYSNQVTYGIIERTNSTNEIKHPAVRNAMEYLDMHELRIVYEAELPARSGLGSSSAFAVGMLNAFYSLKGKYVDKRKLADDAIYLERILCNESGGIQDQIAVSFGGFNRIDFSIDGYKISPVIISKEKLENLNQNLMLFFTGFSRISSEIALEQKKATSNKTKELLEMKSLVDEAQKIITSKEDINEFGKLLDYTWKLKRGISNRISNNSIDELYNKGISAGALGGKLLGAGGGGFILFYVEKNKQERVKEALKDLLYVPFSFENTGTSVLYYKAEDFDIDEYKRRVNKKNERN
ncbi:D-glycero-alpha-D-manno-heptose-7-phosphate kinase [Lachnospiraceae bacterium RM5]|nr:D-glycero-alpha-D-manno-heptose-7-phosphate kinase [Lachnospiraceae bacterium RM5]